MAVKSFKLPSKLIHLSLSYLIYFVLGTVGLKGAVPLDSLTFDKVLANFDVALVKFDVSYPYGEKEDEYGKVADATKNTPNILIAEVGVQDYGEKENSDLAERFNVKKEDFPVVKLFVKGKEFTFKGEFKADRIKSFIGQYSTVRLVLENCLLEFDDLVTKFMTGDAKARPIILKEVETLATTLTKDSEKKSADVYIKIMQKVSERGDSFVASEKERVLNIKKGKITATKKAELQGRLNIIHSFAYRQLKDEL